MPEAEHHSWNQSAGIDLPSKALVYQDAPGKVWLSYNDTAWVARRHGLDATVARNVEVLAEALNALAMQAAKSP
jgi:uncharacterized protein (DUF302 family)